MSEENQCSLEWDITEENFEHFKSRVEFYADYLGLKAWEIDVIRQEDFKEDSETANEEGWRAFTVADMEDKLAVMVLAKHWDVEPSDYWISRIAFHETLELLMWRITESLKNSKLKNELVHDIIRTLENTVFDLIKRPSVEAP